MQYCETVVPAIGINVALRGNKNIYNMYGIVNKAMEDLMLDLYGEDRWNIIKQRSGVDIEFFISNEPYDDDITFRLAVAASEELGLSMDTILNTFGEWWILKTGREKYSGLMEAGGSNLREFLNNLPLFHNRIMLIYPKLSPPEFKISHSTENSIHIHYYSTRKGLTEFVRGLLRGLGKMYNTPVSIVLIESRDNGSDHEVFKVSW